MRETAGAAETVLEEESETEEWGGGRGGWKWVPMRYIDAKGEK